MCIRDRFDYTVTEVESTEEYGGYISAEGEQLVVVELTLKSTYPQSVTMFDSDFQLSWAGMSQDDTRCMPVEYYCQQQLPSESVSYTHLRAHETGRNLVCRLLLEKKKKKI